MTFPERTVTAAGIAQLGSLSDILDVGNGLLDPRAVIAGIIA
jgi:hypothetical protein